MPAEGEVRLFEYPFCGGVYARMWGEQSIFLGGEYPDLGVEYPDLVGEYLASVDDCFWRVIGEYFCRLTNSVSSFRCLTPFLRLAVWLI